MIKFNCSANSFARTTNKFQYKTIQNNFQIIRNLDGKWLLKNSFSYVQRGAH